MNGDINRDGNIISIIGDLSDFHKLLSDIHVAIEKAEYKDLHLDFSKLHLGISEFHTRSLRSSVEMSEVWNWFHSHSSKGYKAWKPVSKCELEPFA